MSRRRARPTRRWPLVVGALLLLGLVVWALVAAGGTERPATDAPTTATDATRSTGPAAGANEPEPDDGLVEVERAAAAAAPVELRVPSLGIDTRLDGIGVDDRGVLENPPRWQVASWYEDGPRPGEVGPAVIAGHVDSPTGPAVFASLDQVRPGDAIEVDGADGTTRTFVVDKIEQAPRTSFPTRAVYGPTPDPQLRLITCDGDYLGGARGYQDNLIVFATAEDPS